MRFTLLLIIALFPFISRAGPRVVGNGGDPFEIEFRAVATSISEWVGSHEKTLPFDLNRWNDVLATTQIESTDHVLSLSGVEKGAINYPAKKRIVFNRAAWTRIRAANVRRQFVLHEFLGIMRIADRKYAISSEILTFLVAMRNYDDFICRYIVYPENSGQGQTSLLQPVSDSEKYMQIGRYKNLTIYAQMDSPNAYEASVYNGIDTGPERIYVKSALLFAPDADLSLDYYDKDLKTNVTINVICEMQKSK